MRYISYLNPKCCSCSTKSNTSSDKGDVGDLILADGTIVSPDNYIMDSNNPAEYVIAIPAYATNDGVARLLSIHAFDVNKSGVWCNMGDDSLVV